MITIRIDGLKYDHVKSKNKTAHLWSHVSIYDVGVNIVRSFCWAYIVRIVDISEPGSMTGIPRYEARLPLLFAVVFWWDCVNTVMTNCSAWAFSGPGSGSGPNSRLRLKFKAQAQAQAQLQGLGPNARVRLEAFVFWQENSVCLQSTLDRGRTTQTQTCMYTRKLTKRGKA